MHPRCTRAARVTRVSPFAPRAPRPRYARSGDRTEDARKGRRPATGREKRKRRGPPRRAMSLLSAAVRTTRDVRAPRASPTTPRVAASWHEPLSFLSSSCAPMCAPAAGEGLKSGRASRAARFAREESGYRDHLFETPPARHCPSGRFSCSPPWASLRPHRRAATNSSLQSARTQPTLGWVDPPRRDPQKYVSSAPRVSIVAFS